MFDAALTGSLVTGYPEVTSLTLVNLPMAISGIYNITVDNYQNTNCLK